MDIYSQTIQMDYKAAEELAMAIEDWVQLRIVLVPPGQKLTVAQVLAAPYLQKLSGRLLRRAGTAKSRMVPRSTGRPRKGVRKPQTHINFIFSMQELLAVSSCIECNRPMIMKLMGDIKQKCTNFDYLVSVR